MLPISNADERRRKRGGRFRAWVENPPYKGRKHLPFPRAETGGGGWWLNSEWRTGSMGAVMPRNVAQPDFRKGYPMSHIEKNPRAASNAPVRPRAIARIFGKPCGPNSSSSDDTAMVRDAA